MRMRPVEPCSTRFRTTAVNEAALRRRLELHNSVSEWIERECVVAPHVEVSTSEAAVQYRAWCEANGRVEYPGKSLCVVLRALGFEAVARGGQTLWIGFGLRDQGLGREGTALPSRERSARQWVHENCVRREGSAIETGDAYEDYRQWCRGVGLDPLAPKTFRRRLRAEGLTASECPPHAIHQAWVGLELREEATSEAAS